MCEWESKFSHRPMVTLALSVALSVCGGAQTHRGETSAAPAVGSDTARSIWAGVYTNGQAQRGRTAYLAKCANCHRDNLAGSPMAPALVGTGFLLMWDGKSVRDFYGRIRTTMPSDLPGSLSREMTMDILAYLLQANGLPAGLEELEGSAEALQQIRITRNQVGE